MREWLQGWFVVFISSRRPSLASLSLCRSASFAHTRPSGRRTCQRSSKRPAGDSASTSTTSSNAPRPSNASCHPSWASTPSTRRWLPARGRCLPTSARTERRTPTWHCPSVRSRGRWAGTAASTWTGSARTTPTGGRSPSSKIWIEEWRFIWLRRTELTNMHLHVWWLSKYRNNHISWFRPEPTNHRSEKRPETQTRHPAPYFTTSVTQTSFLSCLCQQWSTAALEIEPTSEAKPGICHSSFSSHLEELWANTNKRTHGKHRKQ